MRGGKERDFSEINKSTLFVALAIAIVLFGVLVYQQAGLRTKKYAPPQASSPVEIPVVKMPLETAKIEANKWASDALLSQTEEKDGQWAFTFVAISKKNLGYRVTVKDGAATALEIPFVGVGGTISESFLTREQAILKMRALPGYENEAVLGVEMIYGPDGKQWYWGVKTGKGVVTIPSK